MPFILLLFFLPLFKNSYTHPEKIFDSLPLFYLKQNKKKLFMSAMAEVRVLVTGGTGLVGKVWALLGILSML